MNTVYISFLHEKMFCMKHSFCSRILPIFFLVFFSACAKPGITPVATLQDRDVAAQKLNASIVESARSNIGIHYKLGGTTPATGFDCSGLVRWSYQQCGIEVPRTTREQMRAGKEVKKQHLQPGDVVAFKISGRRGYHTGIYSGNGNFIHSPSTGKRVQEEALESTYWKKRFISGRRITPDGAQAEKVARSLVASSKNNMQTATAPSRRENKSASQISGKKKIAVKRKGSSVKKGSTQQSRKIAELNKKTAYPTVKKGSKNGKANQASKKR